MKPETPETKCGKRGYPNRWSALSAMMKVPIKETGQQPLAVYCCGICEQNRWHFTSKSQIPRTNGRRNKRHGR